MCNRLVAYLNRLVDLTFPNLKWPNQAVAPKFYLYTQHYTGLLLVLANILFI